MKRKQITLVLLVNLIFLGSGATAETVIMANGFPELQPVDSFGNVTAIGHHSAVLNLVSTEDANKSWNLSGELRKCSFIPFRLSTECLTSGNTNSNLFLTCETGSTVACESPSSGVRTSTSAGIVNTSVSDHHSSICSTPTCPGGGGCPEPPSGHGTEPKAEIVGTATKAEPVLVAIKGQGAFAERHLALLYDDGFGVDSMHRLAFVTMPAQDVKERRLVYATQELPAVFKAHYGELEVTGDDSGFEEQHMRAFFEIRGANVVITLDDGRQIGLVDQFHSEDWFLDLKQYAGRYRHRRGVDGLSHDPRAPVTLSLATVFIWDGKAWVTDPLQVLEVLSDSFVPSAAELARLRSAVR